MQYCCLRRGLILISPASPWIVANTCVTYIETIVNAPCAKRWSGCSWVSQKCHLLAKAGSATELRMEKSLQPPVPALQLLTLLTTDPEVDRLGRGRKTTTLKYVKENAFLSRAHSKIFYKAGAKTLFKAVSRHFLVKTRAASSQKNVSCQPLPKSECILPLDFENII